MFDKVALLDWLSTDPTEDTNEQQKYAENVAIEAGELIEPTPLDLYYADELTKPFGDTIFALAIERLQNSLVTATGLENPNELLLKTRLDIRTAAIAAVHCYVTHAELDLEPNQYYLAPSQLV